jgi:hypothetical protein
MHTVTCDMCGTDRLTRKTVVRVDELAPAFSLWEGDLCRTCRDRLKSFIILSGEIVANDGPTIRDTIPQAPVSY